MAARRGRVQLEATAGSIEDARDDGVISPAQADVARASTKAAEAHLSDAASILGGLSPSPEEQDQAIAAISLADEEIDAALAALAAPVGGIAEAIGLDGAAQTDGSSSAGWPFATVAGATVATLLAAGGAALYARSRRTG